MRTTLHLDDDVYHAARSIAEAERTTIGEIVSRLARRALQPRTYVEDDEGMPAFRVSEDVPPLTPQMVREAEEDP